MPNQPVMGLSWYEGVAYCRWLSQQTGPLYCLPTEAQWEKAARGSDGREFPWGNKFEAGQVNMNVGKQVVRGTTPVGIYPGGASPFGILDCAGNVWEWCVTRWDKSYPYDIREDERSDEYLFGTDGRRLRGGAWAYNDVTVIRCTFRHGDRPYYRSSFFGCRVAAVSHIS
jgi:formylglycine-generating enzyme required for sulfatase activity